MEPERSFARFDLTRGAADGYWPIPADGLCLSVFLLLARRAHPEQVLAGRIEPTADWRSIGALDPRRVQQNVGGWMLPSSHLLQFEGPHEAAKRIAREQLGIEGVSLVLQTVESEAYTPKRHPDRARHWDLEFLYRGTIAEDWVPRHPAWRELKFLEPSNTRPDEFTRSHEDIVEKAGYSIGR
ncbi:MAG: hypothetical protein ACYDDF_11670 [Thermoplasmatota archaeon]